jgi:hypothetical protein
VRTGNGFLPGIGMSVEGFDGSLWDLRNGRVTLTGDPVLGLGSFEFDERIRESPRSHGQQLMGWRAKARDCLLPIFVGQSETAEAWAQLDEEWWALWDPDRTNRWHVTGPKGTRRYLQVRFRDDGGYELDKDPTKRRFQKVPLRLTADDPFWYGDTFRAVVKDRVAAADPHFLGGGSKTAAGAGTPIVIMPSNRNDRIFYLENPGQFPTYPRWTISGPLDSFNIYINGRRMQATLPLLPTEQLVVDTDPTKLTAVITDLATGARRNVSPQIGRFDFGAIPVGGRIPVEILLEGPGQVEVQYRTLYKKAW